MVNLFDIAKQYKYLLLYGGKILDIECLPKYSYVCKYCKCKFTFTTKDIKTGYYGYTWLLSRQICAIDCPNCHQDHYLTKESLKKYITKEAK